MHSRTTGKAAAAVSALRTGRGFTLIELVIAMVIAAVLAAIAIPSYNNYVRQSRRTDAKTALLDMASLEERYFNTQNVYSQSTTDLGYTGNWPVTVGSGYYQILMPLIQGPTVPTPGSPGGTPASFTLTAVPINDQVNDTPCNINFTLTSAGVQGAQGADPNAAVDCWH